MARMPADANSGPGRRAAPRAVLLDALGTLVELDDPLARLTAALARSGMDVPEPQVAWALRAEIAYYRSNHHEARDGPTLEALRDRCAGVFRGALPDPACAADPALVRAALLDGLRFRAFREVAGVLRELHAGGTRLVVVSNWDVSLHGVLRETGLAELLDGVLTSAQERVAKPDAEIFRRALALAGNVRPDEALHVGDDLVADVGGALAAGVDAVLVDRDGEQDAPPGVRVVRTLAELLPGAR
jgi:putative hydrolase of the HAD superfamily